MKNHYAQLGGILHEPLNSVWKEAEETDPIIKRQ